MIFATLCEIRIRNRFSSTLLIRGSSSSFDNGCEGESSESAASGDAVSRTAIFLTLSSTFFRSPPSAWNGGVTSFNIPPAHIFFRGNRGELKGVEMKRLLFRGATGGGDEAKGVIKTKSPSLLLCALRSFASMQRDLNWDGKSTGWHRTSLFTHVTS